MKLLKTIILVVVVSFLVSLGATYLLLKQKPNALGSRQFQPVMTLLDGVTTSTAGTCIMTKDYRNIVFAVDTVTATATIKFAGSIMETAPDLSSAKSTTNQYDYVEVVDLEDGATIDGDTGLSVIGAAENRQLEMNTNLLSWVCPIVSSYTTGTIYVKAVAGDNN